jgi:hypothetical protein
MIMEVTFKDMPEVPGYEYTGEYRSPEAGEWYLSAIGTVSLASCGFKRWPHPILRKKRLWRTAHGFPYYFVSDRLAVNQAVERGSSADYWRHQCGNYFATEGQAADAVFEMQAITRKLQEIIS